MRLTSFYLVIATLFGVALATAALTFSAALGSLSGVTFGGHLPRAASAAAERAGFRADPRRASPRASA